MRAFTLLLAVLISQTLLAGKVEVYQFDDPADEQRYKELTAELRCLVCQNQNIADSNAELAQDMRHKTYELVKSGMSNREVAEYMTQRYGDFVLYKPPFKASTAVLWIGPFVLFFFAVWLMLRTIRTRQTDNEEQSLSEQQLREAAELLKQDKSS